MDKGGVQKVVVPRATWTLQESQVLVTGQTDGCSAEIIFLCVKKKTIKDSVQQAVSQGSVMTKTYVITS